MNVRCRLGLAGLALLAAAALTSTPADAAVTCGTYGTGGGMFADPIASICHTSSTWIDTGKTFASELLIGLLVIEVAFIGIRHALFKADFGALLGTVAYRVFLTVVVGFLIVNADSLFEGVVRGFESGGWNLSGTNQGTADSVAAAYGTTAGVLSTAIAGIHQADVVRGLVPLPSSGNTAIVAPFTFLSMSGPISTGTAISNAHLHDFEITMLYFFVMLLLGCAATVYITYVLFTAESYIVIFGGIVFLGFSGSSFTEGFSSGYMKYAINNGARLFFLYLVLGIEQTLLPNMLGAVAAATALTATSSSSTSPGATVAAEAALGVIGYAMLQVTILTTLVYFIPNFVAGVLSGTSGSSASAFLRTVASSAAMLQRGASDLTKSFTQSSTDS